MICMRSFRLLTFGLVCVATLPASSAIGATKKKSPARPTITSVAPLKLGVGDMLTIRGKSFLVGKKRNTVAFKRDGGPAVFVKADEATSTRLKVVVPATLTRQLKQVGGKTQSTRFRIRILARRFAKSYTAIKLSPMIGPANVLAGDAPAAAPGVATPERTTSPAPAPAIGPAPGVTAPGAVAPADCDGDGVADSADGDDDNDLLSDALEAAIKTEPCAKDSDGDAMEDAFEYYSALDLNSSNVPTAVPATQVPGQPGAPYPGKQPFTNALDGADGSTDHDGDGMNAFEEHAMWQRYGGRALPLSYSDGTQFTGPQVLSSSDPSLNIVQFGDSAYHTNHLSDDEKDVDTDRLGNWDETHGRFHSGFWEGAYSTEKPFPSIFATLDYLDRDSDGDGIVDGLDDQDHDDYSNVQERSRTTLMVNPYNPCLPDYNSRTCPRYIEAGKEAYAPFPLSDPAPSNPIAWP